MKKKERFIGTCSDYTHEGLGVVKKDHDVIFVKNLLVGEEAEIEIIKVLKNYCVGRVYKMIKPSDEREEPICPVYKLCGGCSLMHMSYQAQQAFKTKRVKDTMERIGHVFFPVNDCLMDEEIYHYRNKVQVPVGEKDHRIVTGFYKPHTNDIIDNDFCFIQNEFSNEVTKYVKTLLEKYHIKPYDKVLKQGHIKHILTRYGVHTNEGMLALITYTKKVPHLHDLVNDVHNKFPSITTIIQNINPRHDNVILGDEVNVLYGPGYIHDTLLGNDYTISLKSFYQINPRQVEVLYTKAIELANLNKDDIVLDAYCGIGTIGLTLAKDVKKVYGIEVVEQAIEDAKENAKRNNIKNAEFICGDAGEVALEYKKQGIHFDVVIVDPPRKGCSELFLKQLIELSPERLVYISCNVATQARDMQLLTQYYEVKEIQPVDMFPQTTHIETVCLLSKLSEAKHHISVQVDMDELDLTSAEAKATYKEIQDWVQEKYGFHVTNLNIAQVKQKHGIIERENYNKPKTPDSKQPGCPEDKIKAIEDAMRNFQMI